MAYLLINKDGVFAMISTIKLICFSFLFFLLFYYKKSKFNLSEPPSYSSNYIVDCEKNENKTNKINHDVKAKKTRFANSVGVK